MFIYNRNYLSISIWISKLNRIWKIFKKKVFTNSRTEPIDPSDGVDLFKLFCWDDRLRPEFRILVANSVTRFGKLCPYGEFGKNLRRHLILVKMLPYFGHLFMPMGLIFTIVNGQILKLTISSSGHTVICLKQVSILCSVTRLVYFWKVVVTNFLTNVAKNIW